MAGPYYVRSTDGSDASDGLTWANAKATLAGALAVAAAGERIWVSQVHAETQAAAMTLTSAGTAAAPIEILCGNDAAEPPTALATTATVTTTGQNNITIAGFGYLYGIAFNCATGAGAAAINLLAAAAGALVFDTCALNMFHTGSSSGAGVVMGTQAAADPNVRIQFYNCTFEFSHVAQELQPRSGVIEFRNGSIAASGTVPTQAFLAGLSGARVHVVGVDLSAFGSGKSLVNVDVAGHGLFLFEHCKLGASVALTTGTNPGPGGPTVFLDHCDSADTQYRMQRHSYEGDVYSETTIVRSGGASDGTTPLSWKMVSSASRVLFDPLYSPEIIVWNDAVGASKTVTVEIVHDSVTNLTNAEVWAEVEALTTSGFPLATFTSDRVADILATAADQTDSSETWTTTGLTNPNTQKLDVSITPAEIGWFRVRVALAKASYTAYVCPKVTVA